MSRDFETVVDLDDVAEVIEPAAGRRLSREQKHDRVLDRTLEAERATLGAVLVDGNRFHEAATIVGVDHWFRLAHRVIWQGLGRLVSAGRPCDLVTLSAVLTPGELEDCGGMAYISTLTDGVPRSANVGAYAAQVRDYALRRRLEFAAREVIAEAQAGNMGGSALLEFAEGALVGLRSLTDQAAVIDPEARAVAALSALESAAEGKRPGVLTGFRSLDAMTFGWRPGQLIVLGGRPGQGKTALAMAFAVAAGRVGPVLVASLEMSADELNGRELSYRSGRPHVEIQAGRIGGERDARAISDAVAEMAAGRVFVFDRAAATLSQIRGAAHRLKATAGPLALVVVDYLQLMGSEPGVRSENRTLEVAKFSGGLKALARDLEVPVIVLSQLSRGNEQRSDKRPMPSDLRDSGAIEQDADVILFVHRPGIYSGNFDDTTAEIIVGKQRNGPPGLLVWRFDGETMRFDDAPVMARGV
jgi:replicative DNA helicase